MRIHSGTKQLVASDLLESSEFCLSVQTWFGEQWQKYISLSWKSSYRFCQKKRGSMTVSSCEGGNSFYQDNISPTLQATKNSRFQNVRDYSNIQILNKANIYLIPSLRKHWLLFIKLCHALRCQKDSRSVQRSYQGLQLELEIMF